MSLRSICPVACECRVLIGRRQRKRGRQPEHARRKQRTGAFERIEPDVTPSRAWSDFQLERQVMCDMLVYAEETAKQKQRHNHAQHNQRATPRAEQRGGRCDRTDTAQDERNQLDRGFGVFREQ